MNKFLYPPFSFWDSLTATANELYEPSSNAHPLLLSTLLAFCYLYNSNNYDTRKRAALRSHLWPNISAYKDFTLNIPINTLTALYTHVTSRGCTRRRVSSATSATNSEPNPHHSPENQDRLIESDMMSSPQLTIVQLGVAPALQHRVSLPSPVASLYVNICSPYNWSTAGLLPDS